MAGGAILRGHPQSINTLRVDMAFRTTDGCMFPCQSKGEKIVIKVAAKGIHPIVAVQAVFAKRENMPHHELHIFLGMAIPAGLRIHLRHVRAVAIFALKRRHQRFEAMPF